MPNLRPIRASEIRISERRYVLETVLPMWEELPIMLLGALPVSLALMGSAWIMAFGAVPLACAVFCVVLGPMWAGYSYIVVRTLVQHKPHLSDMAHALTHLYLRSLALALPLALYVMASLFLWYGFSVPPSIGSIATVTFQVAVGWFILALLLHGMVLLAAFDLPLREVWPYSLALITRWPFVTIGLTSLIVLLFFAAQAVGIGLWLVLPVILTPFLASATLVLTKQVITTQQGD